MSKEYLNKNMGSIYTFAPEFWADNNILCLTRTLSLNKICF